MQQVAHDQAPQEAEGQMGPTGPTPDFGGPGKDNASQGAAAEKKREQRGAGNMAAAGGGSPLPENVRKELEKKLKADFSNVRIHTGGEAAEHTKDVGAKAATVGNNIFFDAGEYDPHSPNGKAMLAHELAHVIQQGGAPSKKEDAKVGAEDHGTEKEAVAVEGAVRGGGEAPSVSKGGDAPSTVRRYGAGYVAKGQHGEIEMTAAGVKNPEMGKDTKKSDKELAPEQKGFLEMYSGNFMRDMNQLNVPKVINGIGNLPKTIGKKDGERIGAAGAQTITAAIIQALATIELGSEAAKLVTKDNIDVYKPEQHIDNAQGTGAADLVVKNTQPNAKLPPGSKDQKKLADVNVGDYRPGESTVKTEFKDAVLNDGKTLRQEQSVQDKLKEANPALAKKMDKIPAWMKPKDLNKRETMQQEVAVGSAMDPDRDKDLEGSGIKGMQVENPELYKVSGAGLQNHIYNSVEGTKKYWLEAANNWKEKPSKARQLFGNGLHAVEDYFSHSNYMEVALNSYIEQALSAKPTTKEAGRNMKAAKGFAKKVEAMTPAASSKSANAQNQTVKQGDDKKKRFFYVDTMYDATVKDQNDKTGKGQRQAITTGTFGGDDTICSIGHVIFPAMPKLQGAVMKGIDTFITGMKEGKGWGSVEKEMKADRKSEAALIVINALGSAGVSIPTFDLQLEWTKHAISPGLFGDPWTVNLPSGVGLFGEGTLPLQAGLAKVQGIMQQYKEMVELIKTYSAYSKVVGLDLAHLIEVINQKVLKLGLSKIREAAINAATGMLCGIVDTLSGRTADEKAKAEAKRKKEGGAARSLEKTAEESMADSVEYLHEKEHELSQQTSIESRLKNGDLSKMPKEKVEALVGPVEELYTEEKDKVSEQTVTRKYYVSKEPLPPSHTEIAKDHSKEEYQGHVDEHGHDHKACKHEEEQCEHNEHGAKDKSAEKCDEGHDACTTVHDKCEDGHDKCEGGHDEKGGEKHEHTHDHAGGSYFHGLSRALAYECDKHCMDQMSKVSESKGQNLLGGKDKHTYDGNSTEFGDKMSAEESAGTHASVMGEADLRAKQEKARAAKEGTKFLQADSKDEAMKDPEVLKLMNLVDMFLSHPDDTKWWKPIFDKYVASHEEEVLKHIRDRNGMRKERNLK
ncbi:MAG: DUF4157 domain-containing protein [Myxococcales bacterium]|nr:DUF4157 domain-containing protein [Myxococcales bacterium]